MVFITFLSDRISDDTIWNDFLPFYIFLSNSKHLEPQKVIWYNDARLIVFTYVDGYYENGDIQIALWTW